MWLSAPFVSRGSFQEFFLGKLGLFNAHVHCQLNPHCLYGGMILKPNLACAGQQLAGTQPHGIVSCIFLFPFGSYFISIKEKEDKKTE